ncbi:hypothetical protein V5799_006942, partial [Amblyomma americanum]
VIAYEDFVLTVGRPDNCCIVGDAIVLIDNFASLPSTRAPCIISREYRVKKNLWSNKAVNILAWTEHFCNNGLLLKQQVCFHAAPLTPSKMFSLPLLHASCF